MIRWFEFLRVQPGILPDNTDDGDIDVWKNVRGRAHQHERGEQEEDERADHEGIGTAKR